MISDHSSVREGDSNCDKKKGQIDRGELCGRQSRGSSSLPHWISNLTEDAGTAVGEN